MDTIFSKIISKEIPADIIYEDELSLVFKDIQPQAPTHLLIIPKKPIPKLSDATSEDQALLGHLMLVAGEISRTLELDETFRLITNNGANAGQSVFSFTFTSFKWAPLSLASRINMDIEQRLDRLESLDEIRQLAAKYSVTLDMRDLDMHVNLFVPNVRVGKEQVGRHALKIWADSTFRNQFTGTSHHIGNHIIEFETPDLAIGLVYSKNEHETDSEWVIMQMLYWDSYKRVDGHMAVP